MTCPLCKREFKPDIKTGSTNEKKDANIEEIETGLLDKNTEVGWLFVVADKNAAKQTLALKEGKQTIGRISQIKEKMADLMIETKDEFMGRRHFTISAEANNKGVYSFFLSDFDSKNKTFLNPGNNRKVLNKGDELILNDGDSIQAGKTIILFKSKEAKGKPVASPKDNNKDRIPTELA